MRSGRFGRIGTIGLVLVTVVLTLFFSRLQAVKNVTSPRIQDPENPAIEQALKIMNGTWKLAKRTNPDGTEHAKVDGTTTMDLSAVHNKLLGPRAIGVVQAREKGSKLDRRFGSCVPPESADKPFFIESAGTWEMTLESDNTKEAILVVKQSHSVVGDFRPYLDGLVSDVTATYRLIKGDARNPARLELAGRLKFTEAKTLKGMALAAGSSLDDSCCDVASLSVSGSDMKVQWSNGGQDYWVKSSAIVSPNQFR
jgi:hypothetical protein